MKMMSIRIIPKKKNHTNELESSCLCEITATAWVLEQTWRNVTNHCLFLKYNNCPDMNWIALNWNSPLNLWKWKTQKLKREKKILSMNGFFCNHYLYILNEQSWNEIAALFRSQQTKSKLWFVSYQNRINIPDLQL